MNLKENLTKVDIDRQTQYEARWVFYHALLTIGLIGVNVLLLIILIRIW